MIDLLLRDNEAGYAQKAPPWNNSAQGVAEVNQRWGLQIFGRDDPNRDIVAIRGNDPDMTCDATKSVAIVNLPPKLGSPYAKLVCKESG